MIVSSFRHLVRWYQRRQFVKEIYRQLFAVEVEREYFRNNYSYYLTDSFQDHITILEDFLTAQEKENYHIYWKQHALEHILVEIQDKIPEYIRDHLDENRNRFKHLELRELMALYCRVHKCKESLKSILTKL
jgi:hypothetical protein